jgi:hypothetical protein
LAENLISLVAQGLCYGSDALATDRAKCIVEEPGEGSEAEVNARVGVSIAVGVAGAPMFNFRAWGRKNRD